jgi:hypothetical protein
MLAIFEPIALPIARLVFSSSAAMAEMTSSGAEVPKPTIVMPTISGEIPRCLANAAAPFIKRFALQANKAKPMSITRIASSIGKKVLYKDMALCQYFFSALL